jgi:hypothetical protein
VLMGVGQLQRARGLARAWHPGKQRSGCPAARGERLARPAMTAVRPTKPKRRKRTDCKINGRQKDRGESGGVVVLRSHGPVPRANESEWRWVSCGLR